jgi:D-aspartate ligase
MDEVRAFAEQATFPVMLKTIETRPFGEDDPLKAGGGKLIATDRRDLIESFEKLSASGVPNVLVQEYVPGGAESVWMLNGYFDTESEGLVVFTGRKLRQYPPYTGQTSLGLSVYNDRVAQTTRTFMKRLGYRGILDIGYRYDSRDDQYKLLDVNPRIGAAFRLFLGSGGMDVMRALYLDLTGRPVPPTEQLENRRWLVENYDFASSVKYFVDGALTLRRWAGSFTGVQELAWFARDDPRPFASMCAHSARYAAGHVLGRTGSRPEWWRRGRPPSGG